MSMLPVGFGSSDGIDTGDIGHSLRFRGGQYMSRTLGAPTDGKVWTFFCIGYKKAKNGINQALVSAHNGATTYQGQIGFDTSDHIYMQYGGAAQNSITSTAVFRDPTSFLNIVVGVDATNTSSYIEVNGEVVASSSSVPANVTGRINNAMMHSIGSLYTGASQFADGNMSRIGLIDGTKLPDSSSFIYLNTEINEWVSKSQSQVKAVVDAGGTNSFMLDFDDATRLQANAVPVMTGISTPSGVCSSNSDYNASYNSWRAFDGVKTTSGWITAAGNTTGWLAYEFASATAITGYSLYLYTMSEADRMPKSWTFEGWTGSAWTVLHTVTNDAAGWTAGMRRYYAVTSPGNYIKYRINVSANQGNVSYIEIDEMELFDGKGLGADKSVKGNNWTLNNFSLTAGATYDWMLDVPGNSYATLNPLKYVTTAPTNGNLSMTAGAVHPYSFSNIAIPKTGLYYAEITNTTLTSASVGIECAIAKATATLVGGATAGKWGIYVTSAKNLYRETANTVIAGTIAAGGTVQIAADLANSRAWLGIDNVWFNQTNGTDGNPSAGTNPTFSSLPSDDLFIAAGPVSNTININFGQQPFAYTPPTGFQALCQRNLNDFATVAVSGSFTGNANANGPYVWMNGVPNTLTINGNAVTFGTHADKLAGGFKLRTASTSYNSTGTNTWTATITSNLQNIFKYNNAEANP